MKEQKRETHYLEGLPGFTVPACIKITTADPNQVTCRRCLRKMGRLQAPRDLRAEKVRGIVDRIMGAVRALLP